MGSSSWIECELADVCSSIDYGYTAAASDDPQGARFLRITDIVQPHLAWDTVPYVEADEVTLRKYRLDDGDIVLARTGASTGSSAYIQNPPEAVFASYLVRLKIKPTFDARFVSYYLKSDLFWSYIRGVLGDKSAQPNASASTMVRAPFRAPSDIGEQSRISGILGALDDKIELNRRMSQTLESMTRALFKSWFVDFDPARIKAEGGDHCRSGDIARLFPDSFEDSEISQIPRGWRVCGLDEIADFLNGLALQKFPARDGPALPVIKIAQLHAGKTEGADEASANIPSQFVVHDGDVLFSWSGSLAVELWCGGPGALNQHLFRVTSRRFPKWFYYHWIRQHLEDFREIAAGKATTMGHIQRHHLAAARVCVPDVEFMQAADVVLRPMNEQSWRTQSQSRSLAAIRDSIMSTLMASNNVAMTEVGSACADELIGGDAQ